MSRTYAAPETVEEALTALANGGRVVAGGTDLVVGARQGKAPLPDALVAIHRISSLRGIRDEGGEVVLGALATHADIQASEDIRTRFTALADASAIVGSHATRHVGTIGGNVMNASPAMETGGPLVCFGAVATLTSANGERQLPVADLFTGPGATSAAPGELLTRITLPAHAAGSGSCYARLEYRRQMEIAIVGATCVVTLDGGTVSDARIAITALAPTIHRVPDAEAALRGSDGGPEAVRAAADAAAAASRPITDVRGSAEYRRAMAAVIARRAIAAALERARGGDVPIPASPALHGAVNGGPA
jgi:CO/xanthine dehydrogenase FAD-binding subunit